MDDSFRRSACQLVLMFVSSLATTLLSAQDGYPSTTNGTATALSAAIDDIGFPLSCSAAYQASSRAFYIIIAMTAAERNEILDSEITRIGELITRDDDCLTPYLAMTLEEIGPRAASTLPVLNRALSAVNRRLEAMRSPRPAIPDNSKTLEQVLKEIRQLSIRIGELDSNRYALCRAILKLQERQNINDCL